MMALMDASGLGVALVTDPDSRLLGMITDGDVRRAVLDGQDLESPVRHLLERKAEQGRGKPLSAPVGTSDAVLMHMMNEHTLRHIPIVDSTFRVVDLALLSRLAKEYGGPRNAVIMAGGFGTRLHPLTKDVPKPMLPVGDRPVLEHIIGQLREAGIQHVDITTHYLAEDIIKHFGDGKAFGVDIQYVREQEPLGTAGSLKLLGRRREPLLVVNGDVLTQVDYRAMVHFHRDHQAELTVAVRKYDMKVPYGVVECDGPRVFGLSEKPVYNFFVNAGLYLLEPTVFEFLPEERGHMTEVIDALIAAGRRVVSFPLVEYWLDIGQHEDYEQAKKDAANGRLEP